MTDIPITSNKGANRASGEANNMVNRTSDMCVDGTNNNGGGMWDDGGARLGSDDS